MRAVPGDATLNVAARMAAGTAVAVAPLHDTTLGHVYAPALPITREKCFGGGHIHRLYETHLVYRRAPWKTREALEPATRELRGRSPARPPAARSSSTMPSAF